MKRINNQVRQRRRQTWLDLPPHEIDAAAMNEQQEPTAEALKQHEKNAANHVEKGRGRFQVEVAAAFMPDLYRPQRVSVR